MIYEGNTKTLLIRLELTAVWKRVRRITLVNPPDLAGPTSAALPAPLAGSFRQLPALGCRGGSLGALTVTRCPAALEPFGAILPR